MYEKMWWDFGKPIEKPNQSRWSGKDYLTESDIYLFNLLIHWQDGKVEPLSTNLPDQQAYGRRMWKKEVFGHMKPKGFDWKNTKLGMDGFFALEPGVAFYESGV